MQIFNLSSIALIAVYALLFENITSYAATGSPAEPTIVKADVWSYKFTPSYYVTTNTPDAIDLNLRAHYGEHAIWLGHYQRDNEFEQTRIGYEYTAQYPYIQLVPSLQLATHDFVGGSVNAQIGDTIFALLGYGRTNAQDYYNLNFDPNDSVTFGLGTTLLPKATLSLFATRDNRLNTDQTVIHAVWRMIPDDHQRWTLDVSSKYGRATPEDEAISGNAISLTYDNHDLFIRLAKDWKVNFSTEDQMRFTAGLRF